MTPEKKRKFNTIAGSAFLTIGLLAWGLTVYFAVTPNPPKPTPVQPTAVVDLASCRSVLTSMGFSASVVGREVSVFEELTSNPKVQLDRVTMAEAVCKLSLKSFCMGEGCDRVGVNFVLAPAEATKPAAAAPANTGKASPAPKAGAASKPPTK